MLHSVKGGKGVGGEKRHVEKEPVTNLRACMVGEEREGADLELKLTRLSPKVPWVPWIN